MLIFFSVCVLFCFLPFIILINLQSYYLKKIDIQFFKITEFFIFFIYFVLSLFLYLIYSCFLFLNFCLKKSTYNKYFRWDYQSIWDVRTLQKSYFIIMEYWFYCYLYIYNLFLYMFLFVFNFLYVQMLSLLYFSGLYFIFKIIFLKLFVQNNYSFFYFIFNLYIKLKKLIFYIVQETNISDFFNLFYFFKFQKNQVYYMWYHQVLEYSSKFVFLIPYFKGSEFFFSKKKFNNKILINTLFYCISIFFKFFLDFFFKIGLIFNMNIKYINFYIFFKIKTLNTLILNINLKKNNYFFFFFCFKILYFCFIISCYFFLIFYILYYIVLLFLLNFLLLILLSFANMLFYSFFYFFWFIFFGL